MIDKMWAMCSLARNEYPEHCWEVRAPLIAYNTIITLGVKLDD